MWRLYKDMDMVVSMKCRKSRLSRSSLVDPRWLKQIPSVGSSCQAGTQGFVFFGRQHVAIHLYGKYGAEMD